jgi:hypothetical protein
MGSSIDQSESAQSDNSGRNLGERAHYPFCCGNRRPVFSDAVQKIQLSYREMATRVPPEPQSMTLVFAPKVQQHQARVFSIAQRQPSTRPLRPLLAVPMGGTILMTTPRRLRARSLPNKELRRQTPYILIPLRASRASHCTTASVQKDRAAPDLKPRHPVPLAPEARPHAIAECRQRTSSVKMVVFILVEA